jgi:hypothetical protein
MAGRSRDQKEENLAREATVFTESLTDHNIIFATVSDALSTCSWLAGISTRSGSLEASGLGQTWCLCGDSDKAKFCQVTNWINALISAQLGHPRLWHRAEKEQK